MKIITLNIWGGRRNQLLLEFIKNHQEVDVFCFQEVYHNAPPEPAESKYANDNFNLFTDIEGVLTEHKGYFKPHFIDYYGLAMFVKKDIEVIKEGDISVYEIPNYQVGDDNHPRNLQFVTFKNDNKEVTVANIHGLWTGINKKDTEDRLEQSRRIKTFLSSISGVKILCGDFNLLPDTESVKIIESIPLRNLVADYGVTSTRTSLYNKPDKFADYIFISKDIEVKEFKVLPDEVSDHSPLLIEI